MVRSAPYYCKIVCECNISGKTVYTEAEVPTTAPLGHEPEMTASCILCSEEMSAERLREARASGIPARRHRPNEWHLSLILFFTTLRSKPSHYRTHPILLLSQHFVAQIFWFHDSIQCLVVAAILTHANALLFHNVRKDECCNAH